MNASMDFLPPQPVVAILRAPTADRFVEATAILYDAGITCVEYTMTTLGALDALKSAKAQLPGDARFGVGTIRTVRHVEDAAAVGADFLVNQAYRPDLVGAGRRVGLPFIPGALTPTEIVVAWEAGVPAVKVSPIGPLGGLEYFGELRGPLPEIPMFPTGGVGLGEAAQYLAAGAAGIGVSRALLGDALLPGGDLAALEERAHQLAASVRA
jgi:2-dehydro-3-deoxyphosphogluconate aldolase / (4S)-4-hydroxy-2-oxoglutarate aldolase